MKLSALAGAVALALAAVPAQADTVLPNLFAGRYCALREIGATQDDALYAALREATVSGDEWIWVDFNGKRMRSDTVEAARALVQLCPQYGLK